MPGGAGRWSAWAAARCDVRLGKVAFPPLPHGPAVALWPGARVLTLPRSFECTGAAGAHEVLKDGAEPMMTARRLRTKATVRPAPWLGRTPPPEQGKVRLFPRGALNGQLGGWSSCSGRTLCAPDGNILLMMAGHSTSRRWATPGGDVDVPPVAEAATSSLRRRGCEEERCGRPAAPCPRPTRTSRGAPRLAQHLPT